jgi:hypothetical protein
MSYIQYKKHLKIITKESSQNKTQPSKISSSCITTNNNNYYHPNKYNNKHKIINSNNTDKRVPNLIKNIHHKPKVAISCDNFKYQPLTSFEQKLSKQLGRLSTKYTYIKNRKFFNKENDSTNLYWMNFPEYEIYRQMKELDTRKEIPYGFPKPRLKPLIINKKDKLGKLAKNLFEADQIERFKNLLYKYKINQGNK